ncbi:GTP-binding protein Rit1 [Pseudonaja textilis]|uniref:GTP-binding protein Rit1 n=1 Tax=Pseudonaja textilis TaxID=8673 RepID=UPI000EA9253A|nr:GTP-binding protein Rit1 [Pseudonaja textilis]
MELAECFTGRMPFPVPIEDCPYTFLFPSLSRPPLPWHALSCSKVSKDEGSALAQEFGCPFFETSAAFRYYIDDVFHTLVREIRRKEKEIVMALEKKSKPRPSVWKVLKSPFCKKKNSVT